ncbi:MAG: DsrE family protein [Chloroflexi bacterium]|nr:DsrE family protein [Chloroflexota bacterium]MCL5076313.1 DsrE family protein [Chloroflexota bacterium]
MNPKKSLTIFLSTTPYTFENTYTATRLAEAALDKGYKVNLFASADGVHNFVVDQRPKGLPDAQQGFDRLISKGLKVDLCGTCLHFRGIKQGQLLADADPSSLKNLCNLIETSDVLLSLGF